MTKIKIITLTLFLIGIISSKSLMAYFNQCPQHLVYPETLPLPIGSYNYTCQNCKASVWRSWDQGQAVLDCQLTCDHCNWGPTWTYLIYTHCTQDIANCNGFLTCGSCS